LDVKNGIVLTKEGRKIQRRKIGVAHITKNSKHTKISQKGQNKITKSIPEFPAEMERWGESGKT